MISGAIEKLLTYMSHCHERTQSLPQQGRSGEKHTKACTSSHFQISGQCLPSVKLTLESEGTGPQMMWSTEVSLQVTEQGRERPFMDLEGGLVEVPIK